MFAFLPQQYLAKGRDLEEAATGFASIKAVHTKLADQLMRYSDRLEEIRERIEGAARLHHLLILSYKDRDTHIEMEKLAKKIGAVNLIDRYANGSPKSGTSMKSAVIVASAANDVSGGEGCDGCGGSAMESCTCWSQTMPNYADNFDKGTALQRAGAHKSIRRPDIDEEDHSKMSDSGLGSCGRCDIDAKLMRTCSCHSFDESTNKSHHSDDVEEEDCFDSCGKKMLDYQMSTVTPNAHLYCYTSSIELPDMENINGLTPKIQK